MTAVDNKANISMAFLFLSFLIVIGLFVFWPKATGDMSAGFTPDGTAVQSDTIVPGGTMNQNARTARK